VFTNRRLTQAYKRALVQEFDEKSKYVFFSDLHRGDDSISDEFARNQTLMLSALRHYYDEGYTYVEAGDGDELWEHASFKHIRTAHTDIFTIMKEFFREGRLVMLYGNHNIYLKNRMYVKYNYYSFYDEYRERQVALFPKLEPKEALLLKHRRTGQEILTLHGHQGDFFNDQFWIISMFTLRYFWKFMHLVGFRNPASPAKNQAKRHKIEKNYAKWIERNKIMLICGHTHRFKFPKKGQYPYFNTGCGIHTKGISCIEIMGGKIMLVQWRIVTNEDGVLCVERKILRGPRAVEAFQMI
jgi:UDP-2,3-diacylglucosamine pyrophosphatase LpxH